MKSIQNYIWQNIYLITTYRCNWSCKFCLFKFNKERETSISKIIDRLDYSILHSPKKVYLKITGGEPFLRPRLLKAIIELCNRRKDKIYKIGIGTNGSIKIPGFFNDLKINTNIFLSRHAIYDLLSTPKILGQKINNPLIDFRLNCNLIKGGVDTVSKINMYIKEKYKMGIKNICFRELNKVEVDKNLIYPKQIYKYISYYNKNVIPAISIIRKLDANFQQSKETGNFYDKNIWFWYYGLPEVVSVKFRIIDEVKLIDYNTVHNPDKVDEFVIHPDGTLTGCWDKDLKIIKKGGD